MGVRSPAVVRRSQRARGRGVPRETCNPNAAGTIRMPAQFPLPSPVLGSSAPCRMRYRTMKTLILTSALGSAVLLLSACGDNADEATVDETTVVETVDTAPAATTAASADWPAGTRIVEE